MKRRAREAGVTLTELLVAIGLGGIVLAGALHGAALGARRYAEAEQLALLQERAGHVLGVLEMEVQLAGYGGLQHLDELPWPSAWPALLPAGCAALVPTPRDALRVTPASAAARCLTAGGGVSEAGSVLTVLRASGRPGAPATGRIQVLSHRQPQSVAGLLTHGALPAGVELRGVFHELRDLVLVSFYVARDSDGLAGLPALRVRELTAIAGRPAYRDTEVLAGVEELHIEEGWRDSEAEGDTLRFGPAEARPPSRPLAAARLSVRLRPERPVAPSLAATRSVALRNPAAATAP